MERIGPFGVTLQVFLYFSLTKFPPEGLQVLHVHPNSTFFTRKPSSGWVIFHDIEETKKIQYVFWLVGQYCFIDNTGAYRMSIITEVEPEW